MDTKSYSLTLILYLSYSEGNVMLLRGDITIHTDRSFVSVDELMAMISDHMLARAPQVRTGIHSLTAVAVKFLIPNLCDVILQFSDDGMKANHDQNISDAITMFPQLQEVRQPQYSIFIFRSICLQRFFYLHRDWM
jgi:hypothetical protein